MDKYKNEGYALMPAVFSEEQRKRAQIEFNYHTRSRGIDLTDVSTFENIKGQQDWDGGGWNKFIYNSGIQVFFSLLDTS